MNKKKLIKLLLVFSFLIVLQSHSINVSAQDVTDEDVEQIKKQKDIAEAKKAIAEAKKAEMDALFPKPDADSLVGSTSVKGEFIENRILGYCAMKTAAEEIAERINPTPSSTPTPKRRSSLTQGSTLVVYNTDDVKMLSRYTLMMNRLKILENGYSGIIPFGSRSTTRIAGIPLAINAALNYLSLLKTNIDLTGTEFNIDEQHLVAEVFGRLQGRGFTLYYPKTIALSLRVCQSTRLEDCSPLLQQIIKVSEFQEEAKNTMGLPSDIVRRRELLDMTYEVTMKELGLFKAPPPAPPPTSSPTPCPNQTCSTTTVNVNVGEQKEEKKDEGGGKTFISYLQAEALYNVMNNDKSYWIDMQVIKSGGNMRIKSNFITNFLFGSRVNFSGGAIVYFNIFNSRGTSEVSDVIPVYEKYRKSSRINETCNQQEN